MQKLSCSDVGSGGWWDESSRESCPSIILAELTSSLRTNRVQTTDFNTLLSESMGNSCYIRVICVWSTLHYQQELQ
jgi:hypothetical protein